MAGNPPVTNLMPLPTTLVSPVATLQEGLQTALAAGNSIVSAIPQVSLSELLADINDVENAAGPIIAGTDPTQASPAVDAEIAAESIGVLVGQPQYMTVRLQLVNPNLFLLAAEYFGDATLWESIAAASNLPPDPQPIGNFQIIIPNA